MKDIGYSRFDDTEEYDDRNEFIHQEEVEAMRLAFVEILRLVYGSGDIEDLDYEMSHLCDLFRVSHPPHALNVERKAPIFTNRMQMTNALEKVAQSKGV